MCLNIVTERFKPMKLMTFYKLMRKPTDDKYVSQFSFCNHHTPQKVGGGFRRCAAGHLSSINGTYRRGFHGYAKRADAMEIKRNDDYSAVVECQGHVHTIGRQTSRDVVVARDMRIVKQIAGCRERTNHRRARRVRIW